MTVTDANKIFSEADCLASETEIVAAIARLATEITERLKD